MLSQKIQDDLMSAYQKVYEEKRGHAAGASDIEKQACLLYTSPSPRDVNRSRMPSSA